MGGGLRSKAVVILSLFCLLSACRGTNTPASEEEVQQAPIAKATQEIPPPVLGSPPEPSAATVPVAPIPTAVAPFGQAQSPPAPEGLQSLPASPTALPSTALGSEAKEIPFAPKYVPAKTNIVLILDASGSMQAPFASSSQTKFTLLQNTVMENLAEMATQSEFPRNVELRIFGSEFPAEKNNCLDSKVIYPMSEVDLDKVKQSLLSITPRGASPLSYTLAQAMNDFPPLSTVDRMIVLVTDGADSCGDDPCARVEKMEQAQGKTLIHVIGFDVNPDDRAKIECIAARGDGHFFLARTENELRTALEEAINSTAPYNLKLSVVAGATPLPTTITILQGGTDKVIRRDESFGTKLLKLTPGTYDILVELSQLIEEKKPSKTLKGVELLADTKVEQTISFDVGTVTVSALDDNGKLAAAHYRVFKAGSQAVVAESTVGAETSTLFLLPGLYDITAEEAVQGPEHFNIAERNIDIKSGESSARTFHFQRGNLALKGATSQNVAIPFLFNIFDIGTEHLVASGALPADGGTIALSPGNYDMIFVGQDPSMPADPRTKVTGITVTAGKTTEATAVFEMGALTLQAIDVKKKPLAATFVIRLHDTQEVLTSIVYDGLKALTIAIPPGNYDVLASLTEGNTDPKPTVPLSNLRVTAANTLDVIATFSLGTLRLRGRDSKENSVPTIFTLYAAGTEEAIMSAPPSSSWLEFNIAPGKYDVRGEQANIAEGKEPSAVWIRDVVIEESKSISHEAIFTAGKIKIIGRGPNNKIITCNFKIFQYGADRELISGTTGNDWEIFEIQPGKYYIEAAYHDPDASQLLKKWINLSVDENQVVEQVLRF